MKYFTSELWKELQNPDKVDEARIKWKSAIKKYTEQFKRLCKRLPQKDFKFFEEYSFHDAKLCSIEIFDENNYSINNKEFVKQPISLVIKMVSDFSKGIFVIKYKNIIKLNIDYSIKSSLFGHFYDGLGDVGYDELTEVDNEYLKHEYLFSTGSSLEIVFKEVETFLKR